MRFALGSTSESLQSTIKHVHNLETASGAVFERYRTTEPERGNSNRSKELGVRRFDPSVRGQA